MESFIHLNVHSDYSRGWGVASVEGLCLAARSIGIKKLALTDANGLYGMMFFLENAREVGLTPILGSEILFDGQRAVLIVKNRDGYANLCRILSDRHCRRDFDLVQAIRERRHGLVIFSDDFSLLKVLKRDSTEDLYVEMSPGFQMARCYAFSRHSGIPPLATNRVYLLAKDQFRLHRILRSASLNTKPSRLTDNDLCRVHNFLNPPQDMVDQFPHAPEAIANTIRVAESSFTDWNFDETLFPPFEEMDGETAFHSLYRATMDGCRKRYGDITREVKERVDHEMQIIKEKNFAHYFLVVADITRNAVRSCGRGSAAASIVSYALGITHVDPIRHHLFFERFLNSARVDPPDIDVDFAWDERDRVIDYAFAKYGNRRTAMVANHNGFGLRSAIREVAKVFGLTDGEISQVTKKIGFGLHLKGSWRELTREPRLKGTQFKKPWDDILSTAFKLQGHFNHLSMHCGGLVIVPDEIRKYCPVEISNKGLQVLQWEKDSVEEAGLVKIDILGNRSLAVIRDALEMVEQNYGISIDYAHFNPVDDPETVKMFHEGNTFGVFYFESPATRQVLTKLKSLFSFEKYLALDHFHLNVVVTSIIRPASNQSIQTWLSRLKGESWSPPHPLLEPVLRETLGVMVFQEQLSQAAIYLAGFDAAEADTLRKTVSKKHAWKKLRDFHARFVQGALENGVTLEIAEEVWQMMLGFDGYSFCKPHSASYTMVAYKSAYLRAHYPAEFMASVLSNGGGYYSTLSYIWEARRMGLKVLLPDINMSEIKYIGRDGKIRTGLMQLKDLPEEAGKKIVRERVENGFFSSLGDFLHRVGSRLHLQDVKIVIHGGCFDRISPGLSRSELLWEALHFFAVKEGKNNPGLFDSLDKTFSALDFKNRPPEHSGYDVLRHESTVFGFIFSVHPLDICCNILKSIQYIQAKELCLHVGEKVTVVGRLVTGKTVHTKHNDPMKFITFEDATGLYEAVFFPKIYGKFCHMLNAERPYILKGRVAESYGAIHVVVDHVRFLN